MDTLNRNTIFKSLYAPAYTINIGNLENPFWMVYDVGNEEGNDSINPISDLGKHYSENNLGEFIPEKEESIPFFVKNTLRNYPRLDELCGALYTEQGDFSSFFFYMNVYSEEINNDLFGDCFFVDICPETGVHYQSGCYDSKLYLPIEDNILGCDNITKLNSQDEIRRKCNQIGMSYIPKGIEKEFGFLLDNF